MALLRALLDTEADGPEDPMQGQEAGGESWRLREESFAGVATSHDTIDLD